MIPVTGIFSATYYLNINILSVTWIFRVWHMLAVTWIPGAVSYLNIHVICDINIHCKSAYLCMQWLRTLSNYQSTSHWHVFSNDGFCYTKQLQDIHTSLFRHCQHSVIIYTPQPTWQPVFLGLRFQLSVVTETVLWWSGGKSQEVWGNDELLSYVHDAWWKKVWEGWQIWLFVDWWHNSSAAPSQFDAGWPHISQSWQDHWRLLKISC